MTRPETTSYGQCHEKMSRDGTLKAPPQRRGNTAEPEFVDDVSEDSAILLEAGEGYRPSNQASPEMYASGIDDASRVARAWFRWLGWRYTGDKSGNLVVAKDLEEIAREEQEDEHSTLERMRARNNENE